MSECAHPEVLADAAWVEEQSDDPQVRLIEVSVDSSLYATGHIPGAANVPWSKPVDDDGSWTEWASMVGAPIEQGAWAAA